ncbi:MAG: NADH:ubiquinone reductase (Na(+)-transporting) subunit B [Epsilonproteobacteria bacterium]|nr:MAG: NADH:ubiquinone reductase (Na(+)-transporting) subunit B [Campylobacterota bacterium]RLA67669.1 MAG: NADH:ubiquinone reductase (Na(+)-transporting) subunit B [Campylobacterota bacterium]
MKGLRKLLDNLHRDFEKGGKFEKFYALYEAIDTFAFTPGEVAEGETHVRDGLDLKRMMVTVVLALTPAVLMAMWNTGYQANLVLANQGIASVAGWRGDLMFTFGLGLDPNSLWSNFIYGALFFLPVYIVTMTVGGLWEAIFSAVRGHEINEGFLVTGLLLPLICPPTIPLWQVALGTTFGVVIGKEIFGGTGKNFLNPALVARAFIFFAYPAEMSGDAVWIAVDGHTGATALSMAAQGGLEAIKISWMDSFLGFIPGSMGETSALACLIGAIVLMVTGIASWRIMLSCFVTTGLMALLFNQIGSDTNPMFSLTPIWHYVVGGYAFGLVFMATDPVSAAQTQRGQWYYGALIGIMVILIRVINPAFPEGMMLAILFANVFAPLFDWFVTEKNIKRRELKHGL